MLAVLGFPELSSVLEASAHPHVDPERLLLRRLGPRGALKPINLADETVTKFGATDVDDLTWKQLLNGYTCTECGRCTSVCPANTTGKLLNPRKIMWISARGRWRRHRCLSPAGGGERRREDVLGHQLLDNFITEQELWACTTCMACVQECPVMIEHVDTIVELRRGLVLNESRFPEELKTTFSEPRAELHAVGIRAFDPGRLGRGAGRAASWRTKTHGGCALLGRMCRVVRRALPEGRRGPLPAAEDGRGGLRHPRRRRRNARAIRPGGWGTSTSRSR